MSIGILTFHSQLNYGGVLQAWALQQALVWLLEKERRGGLGDVQVIDRWMDPWNKTLRGDSVFYHWRDWFKYVFRLMLLLGDWSPNLRCSRTVRFIARRLNLTPYHFYKWEEVGESVKGYSSFDVVVVGSDQVWHAGKWGDPRPYLLEGLNPSEYCSRAVAYAASFGFTELQTGQLETAAELGLGNRTELLPTGETLGMIYRRGLARFSAISCREAEGVRVAERFGVSGAVHVVDPTLLAPQEIWEEFRPRWSHCRPRLFVYLLGMSVESAIPRLAEFSKESGWGVDVFLNGPPSNLWYSPLPCSLKRLKTWWKALRFRHGERVRLRADAGPEEFLRAIAAADGVVSNSFHALMFSIIYRRNVRILRPKDEARRAMFARIAEFADHACGPLLVDGLEEALRSLRDESAPVFDEDWLEQRREFSRNWLRQAIKEATCR